MIHPALSSAAVGTTDSERLEQCRRVLFQEADAVTALAGRLDSRVSAAIECLANCRGAVIVAGIGKSGLVGAKLSATFAATGTRSFFLHAAEAQHGDLGRLGTEDVALLLSYSGETEEVLKLASQLSARSIPLIAFTKTQGSPLGLAASIVIELGDVVEACEWGLVPTTSATLMTALGDAIALSVCRARGFTRREFGEIHPGGLLGRLARPR